MKTCIIISKLKKVFIRQINFDGQSKDSIEIYCPTNFKPEKIKEFLLLAIANLDSQIINKQILNN